MFSSANVFRYTVYGLRLELSGKPSIKTAIPRGKSSLVIHKLFAYTALALLQFRCMELADATIFWISKNASYTGCLKIRSHIMSVVRGGLKQYNHY